MATFSGTPALTMLRTASFESHAEYGHPILEPFLRIVHHSAQPHRDTGFPP